MTDGSHGRACLEDALSQFRKYRAMGEAALAQIDGSDWHRTPGRLPTGESTIPGGPPDGESNSIAVVVKHVAGNMRSRWTRFLDTDGEKPDRDRDAEFEIGAADTPEALRKRWDEGWRLLFEALEPLRAEDLARTVTVRREPHTVLQAVHRQMAHYAYHVGQIVYLARHFAGPRWKSLSIPKGHSRDWEVAKDGSPYRTT